MSFQGNIVDKVDNTIKIFVLMPFNDHFNDVYECIEKVANSIASVNCECLRADQRFFNGLIVDSIKQELNSADIIIADLTDMNPNVYYEVGFVHGISKEHIIFIVQEDQEILFDLLGFQHIKYSRDNLAGSLKITLKDKLTLVFYEMGRNPASLFRFFGKNVEHNPLNAFLPIYLPRSRSFSEQSSEERSLMRKNGEDIPIFDPVYVLDDLAAFEIIHKLFISYKLGPISMQRDDEEQTPWRDNYCDICIGGPGVNNRTKEMLGFETSQALLTVKQEPLTPKTWRLTLYAQEEYTLKASPDSAIGVILRIRNPFIKGNTIVSIFGDRAESTLAAAHYLSKNIDELARSLGQDGDKDLLLLLSVRKGEEGKYDNVNKLALVTSQNESEISTDDIEKYREKESADSESSEISDSTTEE